VAAEEVISLQEKLMLMLLPLPFLITSLAVKPFSRQSQNNVRAREAAGPRAEGYLAVTPVGGGAGGVWLLTSRGFDWRPHPLEAALSPCVPMSPLVDISLVTRGVGGGREGLTGAGWQGWRALCYPDEGKHSTDKKY
jgi:hypothetical protein